MPRTTKQQQRTVYLPPDIIERLRQSAHQNHRSWNAELLVALEQYLEKQEEKKGK